MTAQELSDYDKELECCKSREVMYVKALGGKVRTVAIAICWSDGEMHRPCTACDDWMEGKE